MLRILLLIFGLALMLPDATASWTRTGSPDTPEAAAKEYFRAESQFDLHALKAVLHSEFVEISPIGEIDERGKVLSFYASGQKTPVPETRIGPIRTRMHGDTAIMTTTVNFEVGGKTKSMAVGITARHDGLGWRLLAAQYTAVMAKIPPSERRGTYSTMPLRHPDGRK